MTDSEPPAPPALADRFSPEQVRRILQRASEIDAHGEHADADELRRIAREAGIDLHAMEQAITEVARAPALPAPVEEVPPRPPATRVRDTMVQSILAAAGVGVGVGILIGTVVDLFGLGLGALFVFTLVRAVQLGRKGALVEFELQNLVVMLTAGLSAFPFLSGPDEELLGGVMALWIAMTVLGGAVTWWRGREEHDPDGSPS